MTSWRRLAAGTVGLFLIILAFLAGQLRAGADPAVGRSAAQTQTQTAPAQPRPSTGEDGDDSGDDEGEGTVEGILRQILPSDDGSGAPDNGSSGSGAPGGTQPDVAPPATHQS
jgi:hypothetical protein